MKFLFSSVDPEVVEGMGKKMNDAGIACEVRYRPPLDEAPDLRFYKELWIRTGNELQWAMSLVAMHCEVGRN
jgi:hypothetical protein